MSARPFALLVVALLAACGSDATVAAGDDTSSGSESSGSETQTQTETETETDEGEASSETDDGDETGETGEPVDPEAQDPCPVDACVCMSAPMELEAAPEVAGGRWDLDNDGWLERIRFESEPWQVYSGPSLFEAYMGIGEGVFEEDPTYGPLLPEQVFHVRDFIVSDIDGDEALDVVFEGGGLYYVPNAELFEEQLGEHWSPVQSWCSFAPTTTTSSRS